MKAIEKIAFFFATGFFVGKSRFAPGTLGSVLGLAVAFGMDAAGTVWSVAAFAVLISASVWTSGTVSCVMKKKDPGCIVIDEVAGMAAALFFLPFRLDTVVLGFIFFRVLDITKPFPINRMETLGGGWGIVMDDIAAGIMTNILIRALAMAGLISAI